MRIEGVRKGVQQGVRDSRDGISSDITKVELGTFRKKIHILSS